MGEQARITLGKAHVIGVSPRVSGLLVVRIPLSSKPHEHWRALFHRDPVSTGWPMSLQPPKVSDGDVTLEIPDDDLETAMGELQKRVQAVNDEFEREVLPELEAAETRLREADEKLQERLYEAQRRLDQLG